MTTIIIALSILLTLIISAMGIIAFFINKLTNAEIKEIDTKVVSQHHQ